MGAPFMGSRAPRQQDPDLVRRAPEQRVEHREGAPVEAVGVVDHQQELALPQRVHPQGVEGAVGVELDAPERRRRRHPRQPPDQRVASGVPFGDARLPETARQALGRDPRRVQVGRVDQVEGQRAEGLHGQRGARPAPGRAAQADVVAAARLGDLGQEPCLADARGAGHHHAGAPLWARRVRGQGGEHGGQRPVEVEVGRAGDGRGQARRRQRVLGAPQLGLAGRVGLVAAARDDRRHGGQGAAVRADDLQGRLRPRLLLGGFEPRPAGLGRARVAGLRVPREELLDHRRQRAGHEQALARPERDRRALEGVLQDLGGGRAPVRRVAAQQAIEHRARAVKIRARAHAARAPRLLRAEEAGGAGDDGRGEPRREGDVPGARQAEVRELGDVAASDRREQDVVRADVAVDHPGVVGVAEGGQELVADGDDLREAELGRDPLQGGPVDVLEHQERPLIPQRARLQEAHDVHVHQPGREGGLAPEPIGQEGALPLVRDLDRRALAGLLVDGGVDRRRAARAELRLHPPPTCERHECPIAGAGPGVGMRLARSVERRAGEREIPTERGARRRRTRPPTGTPERRRDRDLSPFGILAHQFRPNPCHVEAEPMRDPREPQRE